MAITVTTPSYGPRIKDHDTRVKLNDTIEKIRADIDALNAAIDALGSGGGDVTGPASAVSGNFASFDGTTGKLIKDSGSKAADFLTSGNLTIGTLAARPAFGTANRFYFVSGDGTADNNGKLWIDTGTAWVSVKAVAG